MAWPPTCTVSPWKKYRWRRVPALAAAGKGTQRQLYFFKGATATLAGQAVTGPKAVTLRGNADVEIVNGDEVAEFLLLQGRPIGEPVAQYGPFVMNTQAEIMQAMQDYRRTQFGGCPWADDTPMHGRDPARFALRPDGVREQPAPATESAGGDNAVLTNTAGQPAGETTP